MRQGELKQLLWAVTTRNTFTVEVQGSNIQVWDELDISRIFCLRKKYPGYVILVGNSCIDNILDRAKP